MAKEQLVHVAEHAHWANVRTLASLRAGPSLPEAVRLFAHVLTTERIYLERVRGDDPWPQDFWPDLALEQCAQLVPDVYERHRAFLAHRSDDELAQRVRYRNSKGVPFETQIRDMLIHLALHGEHHRGQIARVVRRAGREPAVTDYITYVREVEAADE